MSTYSNLQRFSRDVIHPYLIGLKYLILQEIQYIHSQIDDLNTQITEAYNTILSELDYFKTLVRSRFDLLQTFFTTTYNTLVTNLTTHVNNKSNPHRLTANMFVKISSELPQTQDGVTGDVWVRYETIIPHYEWSVGEWSACSVPCGGGTQSRTVVCRDTLNNVVADSNCISTGIPKPDTSIVCNTQPCGIDARFYVAADNYGEMFRSNASLAKLGSLGGVWGGSGHYDDVFGPTTIFFPVGTPIYFYSEGYNKDEEGGASIIFTNVLITKFIFTLHRVDAGPTPVWRTDRDWQYNPSLGSRGFLRMTAGSTSWKWAFSLTYTG